MRIAVMSDPHIDNNNGDNSVTLEKCIDNTNADRIIVCGDITEHASSAEWRTFFRIIGHHYEAYHLHIVTGNMDKTEGVEAKSRYIHQYQLYSGTLLDTLYFSYEMKDCVIIGLTVEQDDDFMPLSDTQLKALEDGIRKAAERGIPALVFGHYALNNTLEVDWPYAFLGEQSYAIRSIFEKYRGKVCYFSGHIHRGLISRTGGSIITANNVTYVSVPSICVPDTTHYNADNEDIGTGYVLEINNGSVTIQGYSFLMNKPIDKFRWTI